jgi:8-oxo-dGTP diphosphatase
MEEKIKILQKCILFYKDKLLIIQRDIKDTNGGKWDFPGGNLDFLEEMNHAIKREIKEETGLIVKKIEKIGMNEIIVKEKRKHFLLFFYKTKVDTDKIKLSKEHQDYKWINPSDLFNYDLNPIFIPCKELIEKNLSTNLPPHL